MPPSSKTVQREFRCSSHLAGWGCTPLPRSFPGESLLKRLVPLAFSVGKSLLSKLLVM